MFPKISFWLLLRLAILLTALLVQSSEGATYQDFRNRHMDHPKTRASNNNAYCNLLMRRRGMMNRTCKPTNTFINDSPNDVQNVCHRGGRRVTRNIFQSNRRFHVITCRSRGRYPNCRYVGRGQRKKIRVACVRGRPVHFDSLA